MASAGGDSWRSDGKECGGSYMTRHIKEACNC